MTDASPGTALAPPAPSPLLALRAALIARFSTDAALARLMGGTFRLYDEPPAGAQPVYALFGDAEIRDDSVDGAVRHQHSHALVVFARPGSVRTALDAAERMSLLVADPALALTGHALVTLRVQAIAARRDERTGEARAVLTLQAVTERNPT
ncbi:DUF3168 domain-containing protein [Methylobacterium sp. E-025]|jgi:hypothetical protein|uniref:DUF3168 domain-containing protein n=1 Tax=unclassified Methylobacterium TaxID=2615210 RepID=UPI0011CBBD96|nr:MULTISPECIES: DUF3168 domain-containing protein [unclassified Methylobacterium]MCJ2008402.1 DUF3168 domain-containing protein [Methylobacterium sp. J-092]MCJ2041186.1 DUF3168 domain-containing protein [Methylobacterium sp. J-059]MCJ2113611.1 DUF3168 domain-containing protein [Methylobacterium sp. E-025]TXN56175.1 DUF3168 domain-containing protein [Methylobacterium sp. WL6]